MENTLEKTINWKYQFRQYGMALAAAVPLFVVLSVYLFFRRGYYDLYIANKIFAGVGTILLGIVLLIGPLSRFFSFPDRFIQYRKELGIVGFFLAFIHGVVSLFFLPTRFPFLNFSVIFKSWPFTFGFAGLILLVAIFLISNNRAMKDMGYKKWWSLQNWGVRLVFIFIILHVFVMKWDGWVKWYKVGGGKELVHPEWPGAGILVGWFMFFVVIVRLSEFGGQKFARAVWYFSVAALPIIYIATFWWGSQLIK